MHEHRDSNPAALFRLLRFLLAYALALLVLLWLLPSAGAFLQSVYDGLDAATRYALVAALLATLAGQGLVHYRRLRRFAPGAAKSNEASS